MSITTDASIPLTWKEAHLDELARCIAPEVLSDDGSPKWGRLITTWNEKTSDGNGITHTYAACVDCHFGEIYYDCSPSLIFRKCLMQLLVRPLHILAKTIYHVAMIPLLTDLPKLITGKKSFTATTTTAIRSIADIIRTPFYGLTLMAVSFYVLACAVFNPHSLYEGRRLIGAIEEESNWYRKHTFWTLSKCFQPYPIEILSEFEIQDFSHDTVYPSNSSFDRQITNFTRSQIRHHQKTFDHFSCTQLQKGEAYTSPILLPQTASKDEKNLPIYANIL